MHIAYLIPTIDRIGGAERQLMLLADGMARRAWSVTVIALRGSGGQAAQDLSVANVSFLSLQMRDVFFDLCAWNRLSRWLRSARPDILHAHLAQAALVARIMRLFAPVRVLVDTVHSPATGSAKRRLAYRLTSGVPDAVTAVSRTCAHSWLQKRMFRPWELTVIPNGIDMGRWKPTRSGRNDAQKNAAEKAVFRWLAVGRLDAVKDYATLLHAFSMLPQFAYLTIAGSGPLEKELRIRSSELGIQNRVHFLGFQNDIRSLMRDADAFVLSSQWEGLPIALMEASASGLPSVFTETEGARELLPSTPFPIAPPGDPAALTTAMRALMALSESDRSRIGESARRRVAASFDQSLVLAQWETLYEKLLEANPQAARRRRRAGSIPQSAMEAGTTKF